jgi:uncharacterized protein with ParB-like and HNH nuclease domain
MNHVEPLQSIFARRIFRIPDYQRSYAWGGKQWDDLLEDLELLGVRLVQPEVLLVRV